MKKQVESKLSSRLDYSILSWLEEGLLGKFGSAKVNVRDIFLPLGIFILGRISVTVMGGCLRRKERASLG